MKDINDMTLKELNAEIKSLGKALNQRIDRVKASTRLTPLEKQRTLDYLSAQATSAAPKGTKKQLNRFSRAAAKGKTDKEARDNAKTRVRKMREAVRTKTRAQDVNRANAKRRQTFGEKLFPDNPRQLTKKEMDTLGKALGALAKDKDFDSEQVIQVYKAAFEKDGKTNKFDSSDALIEFMRRAAGGVPQEMIEEIMEIAAPETFIEIDENNDVYFTIINKDGKKENVVI